MALIVDSAIQSKRKVQVGQQHSGAEDGDVGTWQTNARWGIYSNSAWRIETGSMSTHEA